MLTISAVLMTSQMLVSCADKNTSETETPISSSDEHQEVVEPEMAYPIGDRSLYDVVGNVKSIDAGYKIEFDEDGILKETKDSKAKKVETEDGIEYHFEIYDELSYDNIDVVYKYDKEGKCIINGINENIKYDANNHIASYSSNRDGESSEYTFTYDSDDFLSKVICKTYSIWDNETTTTTTTYKVLAKDDHGNWTKRQDNNGKVEERTIEYY